MLIVVSADGKDIDVLFVELIDQTVLLGNSFRPEPRQVVSQLLWFSQPNRRVRAKHFLEYLAEGFVEFLVFISQFYISGPGVTLEYE